MICEAKSRLNVVRVLRPTRVLERLEGHVLRERIPDEVVPQTEVQREAVADLPVVLRPRAVLPHVNRSQKGGRIRHADGVARRDRRDRRKIPRVRIERIGEQILDVRRNRPAVRRDDAAAPVAVARLVEEVQVLAAGLQIVAPRRVVRQGEVVAERVRVLIPVARQVVVAVEREAPEVDDGAVGRDPVAGLPVLRPLRQALLVDAVGSVAVSELVDGASADDLRELTDDVGVVLAVAVGCRGMVAGSSSERFEEA